MVECPNCKHRFSAWKRGFKKKKSRTVLRRDGHEYIFLEGWRDKLAMRTKIFANAGGSVNIIWGQTIGDTEVIEVESATCQGCAETHLVGWNEGDWFHNSKSKGGRRCDGACCALFTCKPFHAAYHNRVIKFTQVER